MALKKLHTLKSNDGGFGFGPYRTCQYIGDQEHGPDMVLCGARSVEGYSYCKKHKAVVYTPPASLKTVLPTQYR